VARPIDLAEKITLLARDKEKRQKFGANARRTVRKAVDWSENSRAMTKLILRLCQSDGK
jgi:glycosyltransferase involved in cell wall biosynthesis